MIKISSHTNIYIKKKGNVQGLSIRYEYTPHIEDQATCTYFFSQTPVSNLKGHSLQLITLNFER